MTQSLKQLKIAKTLPIIFIEMYHAKWTHYHFLWYQRLVEKRNSADILYLASYRSFDSDKEQNSTMQNQYSPYDVD